MMVNCCAETFYSQEMAMALLNELIVTDELLLENIDDIVKVMEEHSKPFIVLVQ